MAGFADLWPRSDAPDDLRAFLRVYFASFIDGAIPRREDLNLRKLSRFLPDMTIFERRSPRDYRYRLVGTQVVERMNTDLTGENVMDYFEPEKHAGLAAGFDVVLTGPACVHHVYENVYRSGRQSKLESVLLPLSSGKVGESNHILAWHFSLQVTDYVEEEPQILLANNLASCHVIEWGDTSADLSALEAITQVTRAHAPGILKTPARV